MLQCNFLTVTGGGKASLFSVQNFISGLLLLFPLCAMITVAILVLICIRRHNFSVPSAVTIFLLTVLIFAVFIPASFLLENSIALKNQSAVVEKDRLHADVFQKNPEGLTYLARIDGRYTAIGIKEVVPSEEKKIFEPFVYQASPSAAPLNQQDLFMVEAVSEPAFLQLISKAVLQIFADALASFNEGWIPYLGFASLSLGLLSLWGLSFFSTWPLLQVLFVTGGFIGNIVLFYIVTATRVIEPVKKYVLQFFSSAGGQPFFLPLMVNILWFVLCSLAGLIIWLTRRKKFAGVSL